VDYSSCSRQAHATFLVICFSWCGLGTSAARAERLSASEREDGGRKPALFRQEKEIREWGPREVQMFLEDSPWSKNVRIAVSARRTEGAAPPQSPPVVGAVKTMRIESCCRTLEVPAAGGGAEPGPAPEESSALDPSKEPVRTYVFSARVLWFSSVRMRRALVRQRQMQGMPVEQAETAVAPSNEFIIALSGSFLKLLEGLSTGEIKAITFLRGARGAKTRLSPSDYVPAQPDAGPMAFLIFPKTIEDKPVFSFEDGPLTFSMRGADFELECRFPLEPMRIDGKVDW
jgi:hypothetical protein